MATSCPTYAAKAESTSNEMMQTLYRLAESKQTNIVTQVSAKTQKDLLRQIEQIAPEVLVIETDVDCLVDWNFTASFALQRLAKEHRVILIERSKARDRGLEGDGFSVGGIHKTASFANLLITSALSSAKHLDGLIKGMQAAGANPLINTLKKSITDRLADCFDKQQKIQEEIAQNEIDLLDMPNQLGVPPLRHRGRILKAQELQINTAVQAAIAELAAVEAEEAMNQALNANDASFRLSEGLPSQTSQDVVRETIGKSRGILLASAESTEKALNTESVTNALKLLKKFPDDIAGLRGSMQFFKQLATQEKKGMGLIGRASRWVSHVVIDKSDEGIDPKTAIEELGADFFVIDQDLIAKTQDPYESAAKFKEACWSAYKESVEVKELQDSLDATL